MCFPMLKLILFFGFSKTTAFSAVLILIFISYFAQGVSSYFLFENPSCFGSFCENFTLKFSPFSISVFQFYTLQYRCICLSPKYVNKYFYQFLTHTHTHTNIYIYICIYKTVFPNNIFFFISFSRC